MSALDILQALAAGPSAAASRDVTLGPGSPRTFFQLFSGMAQPQQQMVDFSGQPSPLAGLGAGLSDGAQQKKSSGARAFIDKISGSPIGTLLGALGLGILGAGIGAVSSPGARGLGAARGFGMGAGTGVLQDISMRRAASEIPANQQKIQLEKEKMLAGQLPTSYKEWQLAYPGGEGKAYGQFLEEGKINPVALANLGLSTEKFGFDKEQKIKSNELKLKKFQLQNQDLEDSLQNVKAGIEKTKSALDNISPGVLGLEGRAEPIKSAIGLGSPQFQKFETNKALVISHVARDLGGEKGVLTDPDIKRINDAFPMPWMNPKQREAAYNEIMDLLQTRIKQAQKKNMILLDITPDDVKSSNLTTNGISAPLEVPVSKPEIPSTSNMQQMYLEELKRRGLAK